MDVIHVHRSLHKNKKFWFIRIFCAMTNLPRFSGRILVSTDVVNVGINTMLVLYVLNIGWTRDICTYFQQRGCYGRDSAIFGECMQIGDLQSYVQVMWSMYNDGDDTAVEDDTSEPP